MRSTTEVENDSSEENQKRKPELPPDIFTGYSAVATLQESTKANQELVDKNLIPPMQLSANADGSDDGKKADAPKGGDAPEPTRDQKQKNFADAKALFDTSGKPCLRGEDSVNGTVIKLAQAIEYTTPKGKNGGGTTATAASGDYLVREGTAPNYTYRSIKAGLVDGHPDSQDFRFAEPTDREKVTGIKAPKPGVESATKTASGPESRVVLNPGELGKLAPGTTVEFGNKMMKVAGQHNDVTFLASPRPRAHNDLQFRTASEDQMKNFEEVKLEVNGKSTTRYVPTGKSGPVYEGKTIDGTTYLSEDPNIEGVKRAKTAPEATAGTRSETRTNAPERGAQPAPEANPGTRAETRTGAAEKHVSVAARQVDEARVAEIKAKFPPLSAEQMTAAQASTKADLYKMKIRTLDGKGETTVGHMLDDPANKMTEAQRDIVKQAAAEIHNQFKQVGGDYQAANWEHTVEEIGHALKIAKTMDMSGPETMKLLLTSVHSDSVKDPKNFFTHHRDGALAWNGTADRLLKDLPPAEAEIIKRDVERAILTHQVSPPGFMSFFHAKMIREGLKSDLDKAAQNKGLDAGERATLAAIKKNIDTAERVFSPEEKKLLDKVCDKDARLKEAVNDSASVETLKQKMANPFDPKNHTQVEGLTVLNLNAHEQALLKRLGIDRWHIPTTPLEMAVVAADGGQYSSLPGMFKATGIKGPGTPFQLDMLSDSWKSYRESAEEVIKTFEKFPELQKLMQEELKRTMEVLETQIKGELVEWAKRQPGVVLEANGKVPYVESPLKYPLSDAEKAERASLKAASSLSPIQQARLAQLEKGAITPEELAQYEFGKAIRAEAQARIQKQYQVETAGNPQGGTDNPNRVRFGGSMAGKAAFPNQGEKVATGAKNLTETADGGARVERTADGAPKAREYKKLSQEEVDTLSEEIRNSTKMTLSEKARELIALDSAKLNGELSEKVRERVAEAKKGAGPGGKFVGLGAVVTTAGALYMAEQAKRSVEQHIPKVDRTSKVP